jgi:excisionase family DNA binding protein
MDTTTIDRNDEKLEQVDWASKKLGISIQSAYDYARRGILPSVRIGKLMRFRPSDIEAFINKGGNTGDSDSYAK